MKKIYRKIIPVLIFCFLLIGCSEKEVTSLSVTQEKITLAVGGFFTVDNYVVKEGDGEVSYAVENSDVLRLEKNKVYAVAEGEGAVTVSSGNLLARITVKVRDIYKITVDLPDMTTVYDGFAHLPAPPTLPTGSTVSYTCGGETFTGAVDAGEYDVTVHISVPQPYYTDNIKNTVKITVTKKIFDLSALSFRNAVYTYDGTEKTLTLGGTLPEGISVTYSGNKGTDAGVYRATASFTVPDEKNYESIPDMTATLTIEKKFINLSSYGFLSETLTYDGRGHSLVYTDLPSGVTARYYTDDGDGIRSLDSDYLYKDSGTYLLYASVCLTEARHRNYAFLDSGSVLSFTEKDGKYYSDQTVSAVLTINKSSFIDSYEWVLTNGGSPVSSVPYGKEIAVGGESSGYALNLVGNACGKNGEYADGISFTLTQPKKNPYGFLNYGKHSVFASFTLPDGAERNYFPIEEKEYLLTVTQGEYDMSAVTFTAPVTEAEVNPDICYDGLAVAVDAEKNPNFYNDVSVEYSYTVNGSGKLPYAEGSVCRAGEYVLYADCTLRLPDAAQYKKIPSLTVKITILQKKVTLTNVSFENNTCTYDGKEHSVVVKGDLPDGVNVVYSVSPTQTNAGTYNVQATFNYKNWDKENCSFRIDGKETDALYARLLIQKAVPTADTSVYRQTTVPTYNADMTVGAIELSDNENGYVRWQSENAPVLLQKISDTQGQFRPVALYNPDVDNYVDLAFEVTVTVNLCPVDVGGVTVRNQFVAYTGKKAVPVLSFVGDDLSELITATVSADTDGTSLGKHLCAVTLAPTAPNHYYLTGTTFFPSVILYVYNGVEYTYSKGTTVLTAYHGNSSDLSVPEGTTVLGADVFTTDTVASLTLPSSLADVARYALSGLTALREVTLPHMNYPSAAFANFFRNGIPETLTSVTVTEDATIAEKAFYSVSSLTAVTYLQTVESVGKNAFGYCVNLNTLAFDLPETLGEFAFYGCKSIPELTVAYLGESLAEPKKIEYLIGSDMNYNRYSSYKLSSVTLTKQTALAESAFAGMTALKTVILPSTLSALAPRAFDGLTATVSLEKTAVSVFPSYSFEAFGGTILYPTSPLTVEGYAFKNCTADLVFPSTALALEENAFSACSGTVDLSKTSLTEIPKKSFYGYQASTFSAPETSYSIGESAFSTSKLVSAEINAVAVGKNAFSECTDLTTVAVRCGNIGEGAFYGCSQLKTVLLYDTVAVGSKAFYNCFALTDVDLPASVASVGAYAFWQCSSLQSVTMRMPTPPPVEEKAFFTFALLRVYVAGSTDSFSDYMSQTQQEGKYTVSKIS